MPRVRQHSQSSAATHRPPSSKCQTPLWGISNKQPPPCPATTQRKDGPGGAEPKPMLPQPCSRDPARPAADLSQRVREGLGHGDNPGERLALVRRMLRESQEGRRDEKVKTIYFKSSRWTLSVGFAKHSLYLSREHGDWHSGTNQPNLINYLMCERKRNNEIFSLPTPCHWPMHRSIKITNFILGSSKLLVAGLISILFSLSSTLLALKKFTKLNKI